MANPQKENGYMRLANEITGQFCTHNLSSYEWRVLWVILKKTYGFNKKHDVISLSQFEKMTGIKKSNIQRSISKLKSKNMIGVLQIEAPPGEMTQVYYFQKDYEKWTPKDLSIEAGLQTEYKRASIQRSKGASIQRHTKDNIKDNIKDSGVNTQRKRFVPPTHSEVKTYCLDRNNNVDPERFINFYQSKGWMVGKNKMKDWKAAVRTWEKQDQYSSNKERGSIYHEFTG